jgi:hypothetical protein
MMEAVRSSEVSVDLQQTARSFIPEGKINFIWDISTIFKWRYFSTLCVSTPYGVEDLLDCSMIGEYERVFNEVIILSTMNSCPGFCRAGIAQSV